MSCPSQRNHKASSALSLYLSSSVSDSWPFHGSSCRALSQMPPRLGCKWSHPHVTPRSAKEYQMSIPGSVRTARHLLTPSPSGVWRVCTPSPRNRWRLGLSSCLAHDCPLFSQTVYLWGGGCTPANDKQSPKMVEMNGFGEPLSPLLSSRCCCFGL